MEFPALRPRSVLRSDAVHAVPSLSMSTTLADSYVPKNAQHGLSILSLALAAAHVRAQASAPRSMLRIRSLYCPPQSDADASPAHLSQERWHQVAMHSATPLKRRCEQCTQRFVEAHRTRLASPSPRQPPTAGRRPVGSTRRAQRSALSNSCPLRRLGAERGKRPKCSVSHPQAHVSARDGCSMNPTSPTYRKCCHVSGTARCKGVAHEATISPVVTVGATIQLKTAHEMCARFTRQSRSLSGLVAASHEDIESETTRP